MYGGTQKKSQNENTPFDPQSPYAQAKYLLIQLLEFIEMLWHLCMQWNFI